jgi:HK97 gp10 family phage protein
MARDGVEIEGLDELLKRLDQLAEKIEAAALRAVKEAAEAVADGARGNVRVDTGRLREGVTVIIDKENLSASIGWRDPKLYYAVFQEFGTSSVPANPALTAAGETERQHFPARLAAEVRKAIGQ